MGVFIHGSSQVRLQRHLGKLGRIPIPGGLFRHQGQWSRQTWLLTSSISKAKVPFGPIPLHSHHWCTGLYDGGPQIWGGRPFPAQKRSNQRSDIRRPHRSVPTRLPGQHGQGARGPQDLLPRIRSENKLAQVRCHMGQQEGKNLRMGKGWRPQVDPHRQKNSIPRNSGWLPPPPKGEFWHNDDCPQRQTHQLEP